MCGAGALARGLILAFPCGADTPVRVLALTLDSCGTGAPACPPGVIGCHPERGRGEPIPVRVEVEPFCGREAVEPGASGRNPESAATSEPPKDLAFSSSDHQHPQRGYTVSKKHVG